ncbi:hypothetical protein B0H13DRAFT_2323011 [Mycena leptocephala]|nr:hypothetical protein B0H13DRAFT_2323011 [Mycena leptocephala]
MPQLVIRHPDGPPSAISRNAHILQELCLPSETLDMLGFTPDEPWSEFFEFRLRPMIYLVHARVTQDFSLIGRKGVYSLGELEEIKHWVQQALLHCRLLLVCRKVLQPEYEDSFSISCPPTWGIPREAVAMFEIMYRICLSIGFPCSDDSLCPLDRHVLLPLIMGARETHALLKTTDDYSAYNHFGEVVDADRFIGDLARIIKQGRASARDSSSSSVSYVDSGSESESDNEDLPDPADLLKTLSSKVIKVEKRPVNAMDVDDEPAAPPPKKVNRSAKGVSAVSNAAESSSQAREWPVPRPRNAGTRAPAEHAPDLRRLSGGPSIGRSLAPPPPVHWPKTRIVDLESITIEENLQINESFDFEISRVRSSRFKQMHMLHVQDTEEIGKTYKAVEARCEAGACAMPCTPPHGPFNRVLDENVRGACSSKSGIEVTKSGFSSNARSLHSPSNPLHRTYHLSDHGVTAVERPHRLNSPSTSSYPAYEHGPTHYGPREWYGPTNSGHPGLRILFPHPRSHQHSIASLV